MTVSVAYKPNAGFKRAILNSPGVMGVVDERASAIRARAAGMYGAANYVLRKARPGKVRCHAYVATGDIHAMRSNALHMTLSKSVRG